MGNNQQEAPCEKCDSAISTEADRCPECGYEPSAGIIGGLLMWGLGILGSFSALIAIISIILIFGDASITTVLFGFGFFGVVAATCLGLVYFGMKNSARKPTDPPVIGE